MCCFFSYLCVHSHCSAGIRCIIWTCYASWPLCCCCPCWRCAALRCSSWRLSTHCANHAQPRMQRELRAAPLVGMGRPIPPAGGRCAASRTPLISCGMRPLAVAAARFTAAHRRVRLMARTPPNKSTATSALPSLHLPPLLMTTRLPTLRASALHRWTLPTDDHAQPASTQPATTMMMMMNTMKASER